MTKAKLGERTRACYLSQKKRLCKTCHLKLIDHMPARYKGLLQNLRLRIKGLGPSYDSILLYYYSTILLYY